MGKRYAALFGLVAVFVAANAVLAQFHEFTQNDMRVQRLAMSGDAAPGMPAGVTLTYVAGNDALGAYGGVAFECGLRGPGIAPSVNDDVLYTLRGDQMVPAARLGDAAPGIDPPATFDRMFNTTQVNAAGDVTFYWYPLNGTSSASSWVGRAQPELLATNGMSAPGTDGLVFQANLPPQASVNNAGHVAFTTGAAPAGTQDVSFGVWSDRGGAMTRIYSAGEPAPVSGAKLHAPSVIRLTPDDRLVLVDHLTGPGVTGNNDGVIMAERGGQLMVVAREGDPAPGANGALFKDPLGEGFIRANADGRFATRDTLSGPGVTTANDVGIWSEAGGSLRLVARKGDPAPGFGVGATFDSFETLGPRLNSTGQTLFKAGLAGAGTTGQSIWLDDNGALKAIAQLGQFAPGFAPGAKFGSFSYMDMAINNAGDIAFQAGISYSGIYPAPQAIYLLDDGLPRLFMSEGLSLNGQLVRGLSLVGLNELRQMLVFVTFVGSDGLAFTDDDPSAYYLVTVPEPATLLLLAAGATILGRRRRG